MLFGIFIKHQWKESIRSTIWQRNLITNIIVGFFGVLMLAYLLMLGFVLDPILRKLMPDDEPMQIINGIIIYWLGFDLLMRYFMQALPTFAIESYLHLPIRKSSIIHFVVLKSIVHFVNLLPVLVFLPFAIVSILPGYGSTTFALWIVLIFLLVLNNNFLATYFKRQLVSKPLITLMAGLALIGFAFLDHYGIIKLSAFSSSVISGITNNPLLIILIVLLVLFSYSLNYFLLKRNLYPEDVIKRKSYHVQDIPRIKYLNSMGLTGDLVMMEMKLWWRHKRTRTVLYLFPVFVLYGFAFYPTPEYREQFGWLLFVGTFMTGGMAMNYLNYAFGYESNHFDGILTSRIDMDIYMKAKLTIGILIDTICYIITIPYVFFGYDILLINTVAYLFNMGFLAYLLLFMATFNKKRMDLSKGSSFNYQGIGLMNWLVLIPAFLLPIIIYTPFRLMGYKYAGLAAIGILGIIGLLTRKFWIKNIEKSFYTRKYEMAEGFREGA
jgi:hypothetical protein